MLVTKECYANKKYFLSCAILFDGFNRMLVDLLRFNSIVRLLLQTNSQYKKHLFCK
jgi:hypothetical protein